MTDQQKLRRRSRDYYRRHREACVAKIKASDPAKAAAHRAVAEAINRGALVRPKSCSRCGREPMPRINSKSGSGIEAHHHRGYAPAQWLDVLWVCKPCHSILDREPNAHQGTIRQFIE